MKIKRVNEMNTDIKIITPEHISIMEYEMGEWIVDVVDASIYFNKPEVKNRYNEYFDEKYPELMKLVKNLEEDDYDISESIRDLKDDGEISEVDYFKYCSEIYNIDRKVNELFWEMWEEYELEL
jgi:exonuclease VII small subunit